MEPHTGLGGERLGVIPQAMSFGLLSTSLLCIKCDMVVEYAEVACPL